MENVLKEKGRVRLEANVTMTVDAASSENPFYFDDGRSYTIDLAGHKLSLSYPYSAEGSGQSAITVTNGSSLTINGVRDDNYDIEINESGNDPVSGGIAVMEGSSLTLNNVDYYSNHTGFFVDDVASSFTVNSSKIVVGGAYGVTTNAKDNLSDDLLIKLVDSEIDTSACATSAAVLFNVKGTLEITNCDITGGIQGVIVRGGTAKISGGSITSLSKTPVPDSSYYGYADTVPWGQGNGVAYAALVIGNAETENSVGNGGYSPETDVTVTEGTQIQLLNDENALDVFVSSIKTDAENKSKTILRTDDQNLINYIKDNKAWRGSYCYLQLVDGEEEQLYIPEGGLEEDGDSYTVYTPEGFLAWAKQDDILTKTTVLAYDIDLSELPATYSTSNWTPIGSKETPFTGVFDGNGYTIKGATIDSDNAGLFGEIGETGKVVNLNIEDVTLTGTSTAGGIAGVNNGTIENCVVSGKTIRGATQGGIAGTNKGMIRACVSFLAINGNGVGSPNGGIAGNSSGTIIGCINAGDISYSGYQGGIAGVSYGSIVACSNVGNLCNGQTSMGGIAGLGNSDKYQVCYWKPCDGVENGIGQDSGKNGDDIKAVDGSTVTWDSAMEAMNAALTENGIEYQYIENEDSATKDSLPLIIVAK